MPQQYFIGDLQGCLAPLRALLDKLDPNVPLIFVGDLVNRGPQSLETLRFVRALGERATCLLGNHDLHLLAVAAGARTMHPSDTLTPIVEAPDAQELLDWLRHQKLFVQTTCCYGVHAGVVPGWTPALAQRVAHEIEALLQKEDWQTHIGSLFGPQQWDDSLTGSARLQAGVNVLTRVRFLDDHGQMAFKPKLSPEQTPEMTPWFTQLDPTQWDKPLVFGHWSTLGLYQSPLAIGIDTGCLWGGSLTALAMPQRSLVQIASPGFATPG